MTKADALNVLRHIPDGELVFVVRGSHVAAPETLREYARRVLHYQRITAYEPSAAGAAQAAKEAAQARSDADAAFAMADRMEDGAVHRARMEHERLAGLTANDENERLENERAKTPTTKRANP